MGIFPPFGWDLVRVFKFRTVKAVRSVLLHNGGWLDVIRDDRQLQYAPRLSANQSEPYGPWDRLGLLEWAHDNL